MAKQKEEVLVHFINPQGRKKILEGDDELYYALRADEILSQTMKPAEFRKAYLAIGDGSTPEQEAEVEARYEAGIADIGHGASLKFWMSDSKFIVDLKKRVASASKLEDSDEDEVVYVNFRDIGLDEVGAEKVKSQEFQKANEALAKENAAMKALVLEMKAKLAGGGTTK